MKLDSRLLGASAALGVAAVGAALVSQHVFDMQPCAWCVLQRVIFLALALAAVLGLLWRSATGRRLAGALMVALALCGMGAALWQHFVAASSASCDLSLAERIVAWTGLDAMAPEVFTAYASCAEAAVKLLGLPYEFYSLALFAALLAVGLRLVMQPQRA